MKTTKAIFRIATFTFTLTGRIFTSSLGPLLFLLLILPIWGAQAAVVFTTLSSFTGTNDGAGPNGLVQGSDGNFYGTTQYGGTFGWGTVFKISTNGALTSLYSFGSVQDTNGTPLDGGLPMAGMVQGSDGNFYGTAYWGGTYTNGTVFKISPSGTLTSLHSFTGGSDGANPFAGLVQGSDGYFYGTTYGGGIGYGTVFKISTNGALAALYAFGTILDVWGWPLDGYNPNGLVQGSDGNFYGTTECGGTNQPGHSDGTVFKISPNGAYTSLYSFGSVQDGLAGEWPMAGLVQGSDGYFYGTTHSGGIRYGTVFKISTNGALTGLYSFTGFSDGAYPSAGLVQGSDGNFYGTTEFNWLCPCGLCCPSRYFGDGTVFKISPNGAYTSLYSFGSVQDTNGLALDGSNPRAALVQGRDGSFYGTTSGGGTYTNGTVFRLTIVPQPQLTLIPSWPYVILTWPTNYAGFTLQSTPDLGSSAVWSANSSPPVVIGGENVVINTISGTQMFFRLQLAQ
jgi:uncharacterized repeat protein (TIGR03803 family)